MTAQEYPKQEPTIVIPPDDVPGDAPESASDIESGPPGMPLLDPAGATVAESVDNAMRHIDMNGATAMGFGGHVGFLIPNMPDAQNPPEWNIALGNPERTA